MLRTVLALVNAKDNVVFHLQHCFQRRVREDNAAQRVFNDVPGAMGTLASTQPCKPYEGWCLKLPLRGQACHVDFLGAIDHNLQSGAELITFPDFSNKSARLNFFKLIQRVLKSISNLDF